MKNFKELPYDYQVTDKIENIDIIRILRENELDGMQYVFIMTPTVSVLFMKKKFAKRIEKTNLFDFTAVIDEAKYGLGNEHGDCYVTGSQIRSVGFTAYKFVATTDVEMLKAALDGLEDLEECIKKELAKERKLMSTIKITAG